MSGSAAPSVPAPPDGAAMRYFLGAVQQALTLPAPDRARDQIRFLRLLEQRAAVALASIGRLLSDPLSEPLDFTSEGDHILHQLADLQPATYRHH